MSRFVPAAAVALGIAVVAQAEPPRVANPETPPSTRTIGLEELWRVGGFDDEEVLFGIISALDHDAQGNVYALDGQLSEIQVFSPDGEFLRIVGRPGEGPGEFQRPADMYIGPNGIIGVVHPFPGRVVQVDLDGQPAGTFPLPAAGGFQVVATGRTNDDRIVIAGTLMEQQEGNVSLQRHYLKAFAPDGTLLADVHEETNETQFGGMEFDEKIFSNYQRRWALADDGRVAASLTFDDYAIHVWNADGSQAMVIDRPDYQPLERTDDELDRFQRLFDGFTRWSPNSSFNVSPTHGAINTLTFREDGSLWVLSSRGAQPGDGIVAAFDVYDTNGKYVEKVVLEGEGDAVEDGLFFVGDRLYVVTDLFSAYLSGIGAADGAVADEEPEPVALIAYQL